MRHDLWSLNGIVGDFPMGIKREAYVCSQYMEAQKGDILIGKPFGRDDFVEKHCMIPILDIFLFN